MKINYGISISGDTDISMLTEFPEFQTLELPGNMVADKNFSLPRGFEPGNIFIRNNDERRFFRTLPDAGSGIRQDFYRLVQQKLSAAAKIGARGITLVPDWENLLTLDKIPENLRSVLGVYCGIAELNRIPLLLELRIPGRAAESPQKYIRFKHTMLYPFRTLCEIHPHEPGALDAIEKFAAECRFDCDIFRICFDADAGNHLTGTLFERLLKLLKPGGSDQPLLIFSPGEKADKSVYCELVRLINRENAK